MNTQTQKYTSNPDELYLLYKFPAAYLSFLDCPRAALDESQFKIIRLSFTEPFVQPFSSSSETRCFIAQSHTRLKIEKQPACD